MESRVDSLARDRHAAAPALNVVCVDCVGPGFGSLAPGLPDQAFDHDGQLTKRDVRASALAHLMPRPGQLLWDIGAGAGSIAIEWLRCHPSCRAVAVEQQIERAKRIQANARALGVPGLSVVNAEAADILDELPRPDAVFIGGGVDVGDDQPLLGGAGRRGPDGRPLGHPGDRDDHGALPA